jgi:tetratricopeptide (TPR) repeat protein
MQMDSRNMSKTVCLLMLAAVLTLPKLTAQSSPLDQARSLVQSRTSADQAKSLVQQASAADPKNAEPHFLLGEILYAFGDFAKASDEAQKAIALDDTKSDYHLLLGNALSGMIDSVGMFKKMSLGRQMRTEFEKAVAENPKNIPARTALAEFYAQAPSMMGGGMDKATDQVKQIGILDSIEGHYAAATVDIDQKKFAEAEQEYKTAITADPKRARSYSQLAFVYISEKKDSEALPLFRKAVEADPNYLPGYFGVARSDLLSGQNFDEAERYLNKF